MRRKKQNNTHTPSHTEQGHPKSSSHTFRALSLRESLSEPAMHICDATLRPRLCLTNWMWLTPPDFSDAALTRHTCSACQVKQLFQREQHGQNHMSCTIVLLPLRWVRGIPGAAVVFEEVFKGFPRLLSTFSSTSLKWSKKKGRKFHGLVVIHCHWVKWRGSAGQTPCPCSTCSTESEDPLALVPLVPRSSRDSLLPVPLVPLVPTCAICAFWLYHLNLCQLSFLKFFFRFLNVIPFLEKLFWLKIFFKIP